MMEPPRPLELIPRLLLTPEEAAMALSMSRDTLTALTDKMDGGIKCVRIGKLVRYSPDTLEKWVKGNIGKAVST